MKILLCSIGSRGDIQPFLVLGEHLAKHGHEVKVVSAQLYQKLAAGFDVDFEFFKGDYGALVDDAAMKKAVGSNPFMIRKALHEKVYPIIESSLHKFYELALQADVVIYHPKTLIDSFGQDIHEKLIKAYVVPAFTPTKAFANPLFAFLPIPSFLNKRSYQVTNALINTMKAPVKRFLKTHDLPKGPSFLPTPFLYGISEHFVKRPADYPENHHFTGFWSARSKKEAQIPQNVELFLQKGKTLVITFGSMPYRSTTPIQAYIQAIESHFDLQILVVRAWGLRNATIAENERVMAIDEAPFDLLFAKADFLIHHGGAGTTTAALLAGIAQFICPILHPFGDQLFWGKQTARHQIGVPPIPLKKLSTNKLVDRLNELIHGEYSTKAREMSKILAREDGLSQARNLIENHYNKYKKNR